MTYGEIRQHIKVIVDKKAEEIERTASSITNKYLGRRELKAYQDGTEEVLRLIQEEHEIPALRTGMLKALGERGYESV